jgi:small-conductance mechanosensitive channel
MKLTRVRAIVSFGTLALLLAATLALAALPGLPGADESQERASTSGVFDRESVASARQEIEEILAGVEDSERRSLLQEQLDELDRATRLLDRQDNPESLPEVDPPYSLRDLDRTIEQLQTVTARQVTLQEAVRSAERALGRATRVLDDTRTKFTEGAAVREAVRTAQDRVRLARFELRNARMESAIADDRVARLAKAVEDKRRRLRVSAEDLTERVAELEGRRDRLTQEREQIAAAIEQTRSQWQGAIDDGSEPSRVQALRARLSMLERRAAILEARTVDLELAIEAWTLRYRLAAGELSSSTDESRAERRLAANLSELVHERDLTRAESEKLRGDIQGLEADRDRAANGQSREWIDETLSSLNERLGSEREYAEMLDALIADHRRYLDEFTDEGVARNVRQGVTAVRDTLFDAWNFQLVTVDDRSITVGKIVLALILILVGTIVSRIVARLLRRRVFERMSMDASLAASLQTITLYVLILFFFLAALRFVAIPLTALTFVGGALAIGVGFGSQNVVNNFISGLILMVERPIKVGDMIEVSGTYGKVERIGGRSTRVRSGNNTHVIVPNSTFLEKEVLNWTLSDKRLRTQVDVGVAYGSPTRDVAKLLTRAAQEHGQILKNPAPEVLFMNFGDNSLEFRVYFWITVRQILDRLRIQSDIRFRIDHLFRDAGITIAFPQRDVHLDLGRPLEVRMVEGLAGDNPEPPGST